MEVHLLSLISNNVIHYKLCISLNWTIRTPTLYCYPLFNPFVYVKCYASFYYYSRAENIKQFLLLLLLCWRRRWRPTSVFPSFNGHYDCQSETLTLCLFAYYRIVFLCPTINYIIPHHVISYHRCVYFIHNLFSFSPVNILLLFCCLCAVFNTVNFHAHGLVMGKYAQQTK